MVTFYNHLAGSSFSGNLEIICQSRKKGMGSDCTRIQCNSFDANNQQAKMVGDIIFIPIINLLMFPIVWVETIRSFGKNTTKDSFLVILTLGFYIFYVNYMEDVAYIEDRSLKPQNSQQENG